MVVQEEGGPVQADRRLAGAWAALDGEQLVQRGADDLVLLGLDGGDDVEHLAGTGPFELGEQAHRPRAGGWRRVAVGAAEEVVSHRDDGVAVDHDLAAPGESERVPGAGPVEGHGDGGPPVDDDGVGTDVLDVAPSDVPRGTVLLVDPPEEERPWAVRQQRDPAREGGHVVEVWIAGADRGPAAVVRRAAAWRPGNRCACSR